MGERLCLLLYIASSLLVVSAQECSSLTSCRECITSPLDCGWCSTIGSARCFSADANAECNYIVNPRSTVEESRLPLDSVNQVSLESVKLRLKVGETRNVTFSVKPAENFPLDVYMIMDLSNSLRDVLTTVQTVASQIADSLSNVSSNFRVGFGSYVDKVVPPYTGRRAAEVAYIVNGQPSSCEAFLVCAKPIAFEHNVNLTNVTDDFTSPIQSVRISTNADSPEGTLDAMLQAVVCGDVIGWRETSRKILLVITDATIHTAGDGRQAGILEPNDGQCHTEYDPTENKVLYDGTIQDYPSLYQLRNILREFSVIPIFAIPQSNDNVSPKVTAFLRDHVVSLLEGFVEELTEDADNIVDVLHEAYEAIVSRARLAFTEPDYLSISVDAKCPGGLPFLPNYECTQINGSTVNFTVSVTLDTCTDELANGQSETVLLTIPGFGEVSMMIEGHCSCSCEDTPNNSICSGNGVEVCGVCECEEGWSGDLCECIEVPCMMGPNQLECSGRGDCVCGECVCNVIDNSVGGVDNPLITGDACECSNFECEQDRDGVVCSGRGTCMCSDSVYRCDCDTSDITGEQHTGGACQCSIDHCIDPTNTDNGVCSGHGNCSVCEPPGRACSCEGSYFGDYCEISRANTNCDTSQAEDCVFCVAGGSSSCSSSCSGFASDSQVFSNNTIESTTQFCSFSTAECTYRYSVVSTTDGELEYRVEPEDCLLIPIYAIALILLGGVIIIALAILGIIKLCLMYQDYREYKKFEYEVNQAQSVKQNNPVYTAPITHIENPVHGKPI